MINLKIYERERVARGMERKDKKERRECVHYTDGYFNGDTSFVAL